MEATYVQYGVAEMSSEIDFSNLESQELGVLKVPTFQFPRRGRPRTKGLVQVSYKDICKSAKQVKETRLAQKKKKGRSIDVLQHLLLQWQHVLRKADERGQAQM